VHRLLILHFISMESTAIQSNAKSAAPRVKNAARAASSLLAAQNNRVSFGLITQPLSAQKSP
jgi:hypothetical protein